MKILKSISLIGVIFLLCQSCSPIKSSTQGQDNASLVDLGNGICRQSNGLMWQMERSEPFADGREALNYAAKLELGNYRDWRLPTKDEYYSLCYIFELKRQGNCTIKLNGNYWMDENSPQAGKWESYPLCGGSEFRYLKNNKGRVRAVRP